MMVLVKSVVVFLCLVILNCKAITVHYPLNGTDSRVTLINGPTYSTERYPGRLAITFDRSSGCKARVPNIDLRGKNFTIAAWIYARSKASEEPKTIFADFRPSHQHFSLRLKANLALKFFRYSSNTEFSLSAFEVAKLYTWYHVAVTWDQTRGVAKLYWNAIEVASTSFDTSITWMGPSASYYEIGDDSNSNIRQLSGSISDLYVFESVKSQEDVHQISGLPRVQCSFVNNSDIYEDELIRCDTTGIPKPRLRLFHSGQELPPANDANKTKVTAVGSNYTATAGNAMGNASDVTGFVKHASDLCVKPSHPYPDLSATATDIDSKTWYRVEPKSGHQISDKCSKCGAEFSAWIDGSHPNIYDGIVARKLRFHSMEHGCLGDHARDILIRRCHGFYLYKFVEKLGDMDYCVALTTKDHVFTEEESTFIASSLEHKKHRLTGHVILTRLSETQDTCVMYCLLSNTCRSFNYELQGGTCELSDAVCGDHPGECQNSAAFGYHEKVSVMIMDYP